LTLSEAREKLVFVREVEPEGQQNFSLGLHSTIHSLLDPINGYRRNAGFPCQLSLADKHRLSDLSHRVMIQFALPFPMAIEFATLTGQRLFYPLPEATDNLAFRQPSGRGYETLDPWRCVPASQRGCLVLLEFV
jgi:hypothetical protein